MEKLITFFLALTTMLLIGCSPLTIKSLNNGFRKEVKPLTEWDKDIIETRRTAFESLDIEFNRIDNVYIIEEYDVQGLYYSCLIYLDENNYFHFVRESLLSDIKQVDKKLTLTEDFIVNNIKEKRFDKIRNLSKSTDVVSPNILYITLARKTVIGRSLKVLTLQEFYVN